MEDREKILSAIFGEELLEQYRLTAIHKFCCYEISPVDILLYVPADACYQATQKPCTKVFFQDDIYFTATPHEESQLGNGLLYGIGVDPDKNEFFIPYEE